MINWVLKTSKDRDLTASLGTCSTAWLSSWRKGFSLYTVCCTLVSINVCWFSSSHHELLCIAWHHPLDNLPKGTGGLLLVHPWSCLHPRLNTHYLFAANPWSVIQIIINPPVLRRQRTSADVTPNRVNQRKGWPLTWKLQSVFLQMDCMNKKITLIPNFTLFHCRLQQHLRHAVRTNGFLVLYKNMLQLWHIITAIRVASWLHNTNCWVSDCITASQYQENALDERKGNMESLLQFRQVCYPYKSDLLLWV